MSMANRDGGGAAAAYDDDADEANDDRRGRECIVTWIMYIGWEGETWKAIELLQGAKFCQPTHSSPILLPKKRSLPVIYHYLFVQV